MISSKRRSICTVFIFLSLLFTKHCFAQNNGKINIGLTYPISSNGTNADNYTNSFSLNALVGKSNSETGVSIAGIANLIKQDVKGIQLAGCLNKIGGNANGVQISGLANIIGQSSNGLTIAGLFNTSKASSDIQFAGLANISNGDSSRIQVAGIINKSQTVSAIQIGTINLAANTSRFQVGFINISKSANYQIGIINLAKNGEKTISVNIDETQTSLVIFRSGGKRLYGLIGLGTNFKEAKTLYALETGLGAHLPISEQLRCNLEISNLILTDFNKGSYSRFSIKALPSYVFSSKIEGFAGPTFNYVYLENHKGESLTDNYIWKKSTNNYLKGLYLGGTFGVAIHLFNKDQL